jgi:dsRNA-specific ribonuclease
VSHIHHFCACLPPDPYVDLSPAYSYTENPRTELISATVTLPACLIPEVRTAKALREWRTERSAARDASFQAYTALYQAGLLNDHMLPLSHSWADEEQDDHEDMPATIEITPQLDPWKQFAQAWSHCELCQTHLTLQREGSEVDEHLSMILTTPSPLPVLSPLILYWDVKTKFTIQFEPTRKFPIASETVQTLRNITHLLTRSIRSDHSTDNRLDFVTLFSPKLNDTQLSMWYNEHTGRVPAFDHFVAKTKPCGLVRSPRTNGVPYRFFRWNELDAKLQGEIEVHCIPLTRRRNFLDSSNLSRKVCPLSDQGAALPSAFETSPIQDCTVDRLPFSYAQFSLFTQTILKHVKSVMIAEQVRSTILKDVPFKGVQHIITAISAPCAGLATDYQAYEFIGDAVLKFFVSHQLFCDNENWHEGYLTKRKSYLVSNQRLARAALDKGLDAFIITEGFKNKKWTPPLVSEILERADEPREISMKMLADVVEALIGAAYIDGDFALARKCLNLFIPEMRIATPRPSRVLPTLGSNNVTLRAEKVIGYEFETKIRLLESLTHPSCDHDMKVESYQRLEFLGDAVLDMVIVRLLASLQPSTKISPGKMTSVKAALVNAHFLGFLCLDYGIELSRDIEHEAIIREYFKEKGAPQTLRLWKLMRYTNDKIRMSRAVCQERYTLHSEKIHHALETGTTYPWLPLAQLNPDKFYSDMIESIIGAIFLDSGGSLAACEAFVSRIGLVSYLKRVLADDVDVQHPKSVLGQLAGSETVSYNEKPILGRPEETDRKRFRCTVTVGEVVAAEAEDCLSREEAVLAATTKALENLKIK